MTRLRLPLAAALLLLFSAASASAQTYFEQVGYNALVNRLNAAGQPIPTAAGVSLGIIEASESSSAVIYAPNPAALVSNRPGFSISFMTNPQPPPFSGHATSVVGSTYFGDGSMGRGATTVQAWEAGDWITRQLGFDATPPMPLPDLTNLPKVSNHSYITVLGGGFTAAHAAEINLRADYLIDRTDHIMVVGAGNNGWTPTAQPAPNFGSFYNGIAVGRSDADHQSGFTTIGNMGATGRVKPDLVAPRGSVSAATPTVAAAAAVLVQVASEGALASDPNARSAQLIKAVLMAGATKAEFPTWSHTQSVPLDTLRGAGELNINNSHRILTAGRQPDTTESASAPTGWDFDTLDSTGTTTRRHAFNVTGTITTLSAIAAWNREFEEGSLATTLADLDLYLYRSDASFGLVGDPLAVSSSRVDNVEHVWLTNLEPGWYALEIRLFGAGDTEYALAWQTEFVPVPEPMGLLVVVGVGLLVLRWRRCVL